MKNKIHGLTMKSVPTYTATIYVGLRDRYTNEIRNLEMARGVVSEYVQCGLCVTLTPTEYFYKHGEFALGEEPGFSVGLINYPRFPSDPQTIRKHALAIAEQLLKVFHQGKVSVVFPDETVMLES